MAKVKPFHSVKEARYHDNDKCGPGSEIPPRNREPGEGNRKHCEDCERLNREGK